jgi:sulfur-oxidizing protein SoxB
VKNYAYSLLPIFSNYLEPDKEMASYITKVRAPYEEKLGKKLAITDDLLYRRGNFNGTFDQLILDAMVEYHKADLAFSPGFRWGTSVLPGEAITREDVMTQTAITYPTATLNQLTGTQIKEILEDVADNLFNEDPYYQQGGDMVRVGELKFSIDPTKTIGHRITDMELKGKKLDARKKYSVAGWASVARPLEGKPIWEIVEEYLLQKKTVSVKEVNLPKIKGIKHNKGFEPI